MTTVRPVAVTKVLQALHARIAAHPDRPAADALIAALAHASGAGDAYETAARGADFGVTHLLADPFTFMSSFGPEALPALLAIEDVTSRNLVLDLLRLRPLAANVVEGCLAEAVASGDAPLMRRTVHALVANPHLKPELTRALVTWLVECDRAGSSFLPSGQLRPVDFGALPGRKGELLQALAAAKDPVLRAYTVTVADRIGNDPLLRAELVRQLLKDPDPNVLVAAAAAAFDAWRPPLQTPLRELLDRVVAPYIWERLRENELFAAGVTPTREQLREGFPTKATQLSERQFGDLLCNLFEKAPADLDPAPLFERLKGVWTRGDLALKVIDFLRRAKLEPKQKLAYLEQAFATVDEGHYSDAEALSARNAAQALAAELVLQAPGAPAPHMLPGMDPQAILAAQHRDDRAQLLLSLAHAPMSLLPGVVWGLSRAGAIPRPEAQKRLLAQLDGSDTTVWNQLDAPIIAELARLETSPADVLAALTRRRLLTPGALAAVPQLLQQLPDADRADALLRVLAKERDPRADPFGPPLPKDLGPREPLERADAQFVLERQQGVTVKLLESLRTTASPATAERFALAWIDGVAADAADPQRPRAPGALAAQRLALLRVAGFDDALLGKLGERVLAALPVDAGQNLGSLLAALRPGGDVAKPMDLEADFIDAERARTSSAPVPAPVAGRPVDAWRHAVQAASPEKRWAVFRGLLGSYGTSTETASQTMPLLWQDSVAKKPGLLGLALDAALDSAQQFRACLDFAKRLSATDWPYRPTERPERWWEWNEYHREFSDVLRTFLATASSKDLTPARLERLAADPFAEGARSLLVAALGRVPAATRAAVLAAHPELANVAPPPPGPPAPEVTPTGAALPGRASPAELLEAARWLTARLAAHPAWSKELDLERQLDSVAMELAQLPPGPAAALAAEVDAVFAALPGRYATSWPGLVLAARRGAGFDALEQRFKGTVHQLDWALARAQGRTSAERLALLVKLPPKDWTGKDLQAALLGTPIAPDDERHARLLELLFDANGPEAALHALVAGPSTSFAFAVPALKDVFATFPSGDKTVWYQGVSAVRELLGDRRLPVADALALTDTLFAAHRGVYLGSGYVKAPLLVEALVGVLRRGELDDAQRLQLVRRLVVLDGEGRRGAVVELLERAESERTLLRPAELDLLRGAVLARPSPVPLPLPSFGALVPD